MSNIELYEQEKQSNPDHVATPRGVVENIYDKIKINEFKMCWFPFNHYDSEFKLPLSTLETPPRASNFLESQHHLIRRVVGYATTSNQYQR